MREFFKNIQLAWWKRQATRHDFAQRKLETASRLKRDELDALREQLQTNHKIGENERNILEVAPRNRATGVPDSPKAKAILAKFEPSDQATVVAFLNKMRQTYDAYKTNANHAKAAEKRKRAYRKKIKAAGGSAK